MFEFTDMYRFNHATHDIQITIIWSHMELNIHLL